jgi:hypothetical protein
LINGSDSKSQFAKGVSEFGEVSNALLKNDDAELVDGIGDVIVVLTILAAQNGLLIEDCVSNSVQPDDYPATVTDYSLYLFAAVHFGFLGDAILKGQTKKVGEHIGHIAVCLSGLAKVSNLSFISCVESSYNEIKDRKGVMYNGAFIKSDDERYAGVMAELGKEIQ